MSSIQLLIFTVLLISAQLLYLEVAKYFQIVDQPNVRSSHTVTTITGAGIIFIIAMISYPIFSQLNYGYFLAGLFIAGLISFLDDLRPVSYKIRILCQFIAVGLLFYQLNVFNLPALLLPLLFVLGIGIINAVNFMDGINGMIGGYAFITLGTLLYINAYVEVGFGDNSLIVTAMLAVLVFNYFNFRTRARCFAGDIGSVSLAVILIFLIGDLILSSGNVSYILLLFLYGLDTVTTIFFRLFRKENIFEAHRSHYFQFLVHEKKIPHLYVSSGYAVVQLLLNALLIFSLRDSLLAGVAFALVVTYVFVILRFWMEGKKRLLTYTVYEKAEA